MPFFKIYHGMGGGFGGGGGLFRRGLGGRFFGRLGGCRFCRHGVTPCWGSKARGGAWPMPSHGTGKD